MNSGSLKGAAHHVEGRAAWLADSPRNRCAVTMPTAAMAGEVLLAEEIARGAKVTKAFCVSLPS